MARTADDLIRLTPSSVRRIVACRSRWGWAPGMPVLIVRKDSRFALTVPRAGVAPITEYSSRGVRLAVLSSQADHFRGSVLSSLYDALFEMENWWLENPNDRGQSGCSDPLGASCCPYKFRQLHPELFTPQGLADQGLAVEDRDQLLARTSAYLRWGDGRAAVVLRTVPFVVATYCDEMDAAFLLNFPNSLAHDYDLMTGSRLVTTNLHYRGDKGVAPDIKPGPGYHGRYTNVRPLVANFLAAEEHLVEARRVSIAEREYRRCQELGEQALRSGQPIRSGRPLEAAMPATQ